MHREVKQLVDHSALEGVGHSRLAVESLTYSDVALPLSMTSSEENFLTVSTDIPQNSPRRHHEASGQPAALR